MKDINVVGDIRLLTRREVEDLDIEHRKINSDRHWFWTMTPYIDMTELEGGCYANVILVHSNGDLDYDNVNSAYGLRPVFKIKLDKGR